MENLDYATDMALARQRIDGADKLVPLFGEIEQALDEMNEVGQDAIAAWWDAAELALRHFDDALETLLSDRPDASSNPNKHLV